VGVKAEVVPPVEGMTKRAEADGDVVTYADGRDIGDAVATAAAADIAVVFVADGGSEGVDRPSLAAQDNTCTLFGCTPATTPQDQIVEQVAAVNPNTVVVLQTGAPVSMPWLSKVRGVLEMWYPGEQDGNAAAALLFGDVAPSGKLPYTFPKSLSQTPIRSSKQYPGRQGPGRLPPLALHRAAARRLPLVRRQAHQAAVPVRFRPVLHDFPLRPPACDANAERSRRPVQRHQRRPTHGRRGRTGLPLRSAGGT